jgi:L-seryl-tRNA(Ser) seleniumtransferase
MGSHKQEQPRGFHQSLRQIPSIDSLLAAEELQTWAAGLPQKIVTDALRLAVEQTRQDLLENGNSLSDQAALRRLIFERAQLIFRQVSGPHFRKVINATGIILHTALGRAVLPERAIKQIQEQIDGYSLLQADLETGRRSRRDERIAWLLRQLTGAEDATVVNNNAAATLLVLNTIGKGREVIVSRGQLVEIGGSFRLPEVMEASGANMVEVGTTNKTHPKDYERAITENTAAILRAHPSNYQITGFSAEVSADELVRISRAHGVVMIDDVGAGALIDFKRFGFADQPTLQDSVKAGADLITASADKLIGAGQGGIILGRSELIEEVRKNPLARAVRVDKLTLAALEATLTLFMDESTALQEVPTLQMMRLGIEEIGKRAQHMATTLSAAKPSAKVKVKDGFSQMGSGSLPGENLPTKLLTIQTANMGPDELARRLRHHEPPIFTRIHKDEVLLDPRTILAGEDEVIVQALKMLVTDGA